MVEDDLVNAVERCQRFVFGWTSVVSLDIISNGGERKLRTISPLTGIAILVCHRTSTTIWTSQAIQTDDEESGDIEGLTRTAHERAPPICDICAPAEGMTYDQDIVSVF
jgi:hypothetical protein